ncbi:hypothetical protein [Psychrobacter sp. I-STPA6b]|uniref:hypothetical protein n=1 Tax=Psychrobacter sp. I-STPA6b TaxID=2585718 RepID=UPI001D0CC56F|nr:hypothetical protein [Psychrobacter sp. I-STPA6b]
MSANNHLRSQNPTQQNDDNKQPVNLILAPCLFIAIFIPLLTNANVPESIQVSLAIVTTAVLLAILCIAWRQGKLRLPVLLSFVGLGSGLIFWVLLVE